MPCGTHLSVISKSHSKAETMAADSAKHSLGKVRRNDLRRNDAACLGCFDTEDQVCEIGGSLQKFIDRRGQRIG